MKKKLPAKLRANLDEYTSRSSIHGVNYTADQTIPAPDRILWLLLFLGSISLAVFMISKTVVDWQEDPTVTTLETMTEPVEGQVFPTVTICGSGQNMDLVEKVVYQKFLKWKSSKKIRAKRQTIVDDDIYDDFSHFLEEVYQIAEGQGLMSVLSAMTAPRPEAAESSSVAKKEQTCGLKAAYRKKRQTETDRDQEPDTREKETKRDRQRLGTSSGIKFLNHHYSLEII